MEILEVGLVHDKNSAVEAYDAHFDGAESGGRDDEEDVL
jgi:hypothetical protein